MIARGTAKDVLVRPLLCRWMLSFFLQQAFGDAGRVARALPFIHHIFSADRETILAGARASGFRAEGLRDHPDLGPVLFSAQAANVNRLAHLRRLRDETRELREVLEAEPALRGIP